MTVDGPQPHLDDELHLLLDGRLDAATRDRVLEHLESCRECARRHDALRSLKRTLAELREDEADVSASAETRAAIHRVLALEDRRTRRKFFLRLGGSVAASIVVLVGVVLWLRPPERGIGNADMIAADHRALERGAVALELKTTDVAELEGFFAARQLGFPTRVFDLSMMGYRLVGGAVLRREDGPHVLIVYRAANGALVICQMYRGAVDRALPHAERRIRDRVTLYVEHRDDLTLAFWQEGAVVCVLASRIEPEAVIELAFAKASVGGSVPATPLQ